MGLTGELYFPDDLITAEFINRKNRFVAVVNVDGKICEAHIPTTSRMKELLFPGAIVYLAYNPGINRITKYDLKVVQYNGILVSVDSGVPNRILKKSFQDRMVHELSGWSLEKSEITIGSSRLDFLLDNSGKKMYVEAKSVTLAINNVAFFPDAPTARGTRHLHELIEVINNGFQAAVIFIIQRDDVTSFSPNRITDRAFADALQEAKDAGVIILPLKCQITTKSIKIIGSVPVIW